MSIINGKNGQKMKPTATYRPGKMPCLRCGVIKYVNPRQRDLSQGYYCFDCKAYKPKKETAK